MTELLGREDCIKSLRQDLVDIQGAILEIFSRTGPVLFSSWKFPDKLSCDLDILTLLEEYDFVDGDESFNQHCHIVLLELIIDRLLLLLQSASTYVGQQRGIYRKEQKGCLTVALVVRNYFSHFVHFGNKREISNVTNQTRTKTNGIDKLQTMSPKSSLTSTSTRTSSTWSSEKLDPLPPQIPEYPTPKHKSPFQLKLNRHHVSCQTNISLGICNACQEAQSLMRLTGHFFIEFLRSQGLPSSLQPLLKFVDAAIQMGCMTAGDVAQWANEQLRDMRRVANHLQDMKATIQPLKDKLEKTETERETFKSQLESAQIELKQVVETHEANINQLDLSLQKSLRSMTEREETFQKLQQDLQNEILSLMKRNKELESETSLQQETVQVLECENNQLEGKLKSLEIDNEAYAQLQERVQQFDTQMSETKLLLDKENAKYQSACRQQESMQAKQRSLLERVDILDKENEELLKELGEKDVENMDLQNQLEKKSEDNKQLQMALTHQQTLNTTIQNDKQKLEAHVDELKKQHTALTEEVKALQEREMLLVTFPELNNCSHAPQQMQGTGDILLDMEQQMKANNIRIKVLEQENATLRNCITKLKQKVQQSVTTENFHQQAEHIPTKKQQNVLTKEFITEQQSNTSGMQQDSKGS